MSMARGRMILSVTFALEFPRERLMSMTIRLLVDPSAFCLRIKANLEAVPF